MLLGHVKGQGHMIRSCGQTSVTVHDSKNEQPHCQMSPPRQGHRQLKHNTRLLLPRIRNTLSYFLCFHISFAISHLPFLSPEVNENEAAQ